MKQSTISAAGDRVLVVLLFLILTFSLVVAIIDSFSAWSPPASWMAPLILSALYVIVKLVGPLPEIHTDVRYLRGVADVRVQRMQTAKDLYENLGRAIDAATMSLDLTHIQDVPPADFGYGAVDFFERVLTWSAEENRSVRRIISVRSPTMYKWALLLNDATREMPRFHIRVIDWATEVPALNMTILDGKVVYLTLTGSTVERPRGLGIHDEKTTQYFTDYYDNLWAVSIDLEDWLRTNHWEPATARR